MRHAARVLLLIVLALVGCRANAPVIKPSADAPKYLAADGIDVLELLPDPPSAKSMEHEQEYATLSRVQTIRTPADVARVEREVHMDVFVFDDVMGQWFNVQSCPRTLELFNQVGQDARFFSNRGKKHWNRPRPATRPGFVPLSSEPSASYPSGHSTRATAWSLILAEMYAHKRDALLERGREIGFGRVVVGVHYPTDIFAGRVLGKAVAREMLANPAFRAELAKVKAELDRAASVTQTVSR